MVELFQYTELKSSKVFSHPTSKKKEGRYEFKDLAEIKFKKGTKPEFSLIYGQEHRVEGKKILEAAKELSRKMIEDAENRVKEIEKAAYDKGKQQALEDGKIKLEPVLVMFQQKLEELFQHQKEIVTNSEEDILNLTLALTSRIIHHEVRTHKDIVLGAIRSAMNKVLNREQITIRINPEDMEYVLQNKLKFKDDLNNIQQVFFKEDASVSKSGCIIDTDYGSIDALLEKEFEELNKLLRKEFADSKDKKEYPPYPSTNSDDRK